MYFSEGYYHMVHLSLYSTWVNFLFKNTLNQYILKSIHNFKIQTHVFLKKRFDKTRGKKIWQRSITLVQLFTWAEDFKTIMLNCFTNPSIKGHTNYNLKMTFISLNELFFLIQIQLFCLHK